MVCNKTRIAPTPSGFLHLGNILSFSLTATLARKTGASILLRIDDLDRERARREYVQEIFDTLNFLEIPWDEGPADASEFEREYSQLHRMKLYRGALQQLAESGAVFACSCSRSQIPGVFDVGYPGTCRDLGLPLDTPDTSWRLRTVDLRMGGFQNGDQGMGDRVALRFRSYADGVVSAELPASMRDFVVRKKDGFPAYQLASLVDDSYYGVDLIVRGADLLPSTLAQLYLAGVLDMPAFSESIFYHHALLKGTSGEKLSKSAGDTSVRYLRGQGLKPAAIYRLIAGQLGLREAAGNWEELGELVLSMPAGAFGPAAPSDPSALPPAPAV